MASVFATLAFHWAGRENRFTDQIKDGSCSYSAHKLYYGTALAPLPDRQPISLPPYTARIEIGKWLDTKIAAFHAHQTQSPVFPLFDEHVKKIGNPELFHLAATIMPGALPMETDLFEGIEQQQAA